MASNKNIKCKNCGKKLTGKQRKFCSVKCSNEAKNSGRKTKLNEEMKNDIRQKLELGLNYKDVCMAVGISFETFNTWRKTNPEFSELVDRANAKVKETSLKSIRMGEIRDWRAAAWRLERRWPEEYKEKKEVELKEQPILIDDIMGDIDEEDI
jgi:hypothetical protein